MSLVFAVVEGFAALSPDDRWQVADWIVEIMSAGPPLPAFTTIKAEAEIWASWASIAELKAYIAAAVAHLSPADRAGLRAYLERLA